MNTSRPFVRNSANPILSLRSAGSFGVTDGKGQTSLLILTVMSFFVTWNTMWSTGSCFILHIYVSFCAYCVFPSHLSPHFDRILAILSSIILLYCPVATLAFVPSVPVTRPITRLAGTIA